MKDDLRDYVDKWLFRANEDLAVMIYCRFKPTRRRMPRPFAFMPNRQPRST